MKNSSFGYKRGTLIASESHQGNNYHLIFLVAEGFGGREVELVIKEGPGVCETLLYNPSAEAIKYDTLMPGPVASKLDVALREYSKQISKRRAADQPKAP